MPPPAVAVPVLALGLVLAALVSGQSIVSTLAGLVTVRFAGGSTSGVLSLFPDFTYAT